jgi:hypothetical protein
MACRALVGTIAENLSAAALAARPVAAVRSRASSAISDAARLAPRCTDGAARADTGTPAGLRRGNLDQRE